MLDAVETLIGPEITSNSIQHVRTGPPEWVVAKDEIRAHVVSTDWHQDQGVALPEADESTFVTVWLAITDATIENGCLKVAVDRYDEMMPHCPKIQTALADPYIPESFVPVPVKARGAVTFHPMAPHASLANESDGYRWSFDLRYSVTGHPTGPQPLSGVCRAVPEQSCERTEGLAGMEGHVGGDSQPYGQFTAYRATQVGRVQSPLCLRWPKF